MGTDTEMKERYSNYGEAFQDKLGSTYAKLMSDDLFEDDDYDIDNTDTEFRKYEKPKSLALKDMVKDFSNDMDSRHEFKKSIIPFNTKFKDFDFEDSFDFDDIEDDMPLRRKLKGRPSNSHYHLKHGTFGESKIDKLLSKYYVVNENEIKNKYKKLSETDFQFDTTIQYLKENPNSTFMGKSSKGNLIFKNGLKENKITKSGVII
jgi:hypothetical protein